MKTMLFKGTVKTVGKEDKVYENEKMVVVGRVVRAPHVSEKAVTLDLVTLAKEGEFVRIVILNDKQREVAAKYLQKGAVVTVIGNHKVETYPKKDNSGEGQRDVIYVDNFQISVFVKSDEVEAGETQTAPVTPVNEDDDLPF